MFTTFESGQAQALGLINTLDIGMGANDAEISFVTSYQNAAGRYQWATIESTWAECAYNAGGNGAGCADGVAEGCAGGVRPAPLSR